MKRYNDKNDGRNGFLRNLLNFNYLKKNIVLIVISFFNPLRLCAFACSFALKSLLSRLKDYIFFITNNLEIGVYYTINAYQ